MKKVWNLVKNSIWKFFKTFVFYKEKHKDIFLVPTINFYMGKNDKNKIVYIVISLMFLCWSFNMQVFIGRNRV